MEEFLPLQNGITYGPVLSRRLGRSLGINILSPYRKICSFDCVYCQYGSTSLHDFQPPAEAFPSSSWILREVEKALVLHKHLDYLTFSGNGEPTLHPEFERIVEGVRHLRDQSRPDVKIALFTNSTTLGNGAVRRAIGYIDLPIFKMDAGDLQMFESVDHPVKEIRIMDIIEQLASRPKSTIQSIVLAGEMENPDSPQFQAYLRAIQRIKPHTIQLYSCDWNIPSRGVEKLPLYKLSRIADAIRDKCVCDVQIY